MSNPELRPGAVRLPDSKMVLNRDLLGDIADGLLDLEQKVLPDADIRDPEVEAKVRRTIAQAHLVILMLHAGAPE